MHALVEAAAQMVTLSGVSPQGLDPMVLGAYRRKGADASSWLNGRPVYSLLSGDDSHIWHEGGFWFVGPEADIGSYLGYLYVEDVAFVAENISDVWIFGDCSAPLAVREVVEARGLRVDPTSAAELATGRWMAGLQEVESQAHTSSNRFGELTPQPPQAGWQADGEGSQNVLLQAAASAIMGLMVAYAAYAVARSASARKIMAARKEAGEVEGAGERGEEGPAGTRGVNSAAVAVGVANGVAGPDAPAASLVGLALPAARSAQHSPVAACPTWGTEATAAWKRARAAVNAEGSVAVASEAAVEATANEQATPPEAMVVEARAQVEAAASEAAA